MYAYLEAIYLDLQPTTEILMIRRTAVGILRDSVASETISVKVC